MAKRQRDKNMSGPRDPNEYCVFLEVKVISVWLHLSLKRWYLKGRLGQDHTGPSKPCEGTGLPSGHGILKVG